MKIIALVGMPGSGKSEASKVASDLNIPIISMGDIIREEVIRLNKDPKLCGNIASDLRSKEGLDAIAKRCAPKIQKLIDSKEYSIIIIDGIRGIDEIKYFGNVFHQKIILILVSIDTSIESRFRRILDRKREDDMITIEKLKQRDQKELKWGMKEAIKKANIIIENNTTLEDFKIKVKKILYKIMNK